MGSDIADDEDIEVDLIFRKTDEADDGILRPYEADISEEPTGEDVAMQEHQDLEDVLALIGQAGGDGIATEDLLVSSRDRLLR